jgi:hypothetical protein
MFFNEQGTLGDIFDFGFGGGDYGFGLNTGISIPANSSTSISNTSNNPAWLDVFNTASGLASQIINAIGKRPTTQIGVGGVTALPNATGQAGYYGTGLQTTQQYPYGASQNVGTQVGSTLGSGLDGVFNWVVANPLVTGAFALGLFLLFREPPRRR